jgi:hypothetical protein
LGRSCGLFYNRILLDHAKKNCPILRAAFSSV